MTDTISPMAYRINTAAKLADVSRNTVFKAIRSGELAASRRGKRLTLISHDSLQSWLANLEKVTPQQAA